MINIENKNEYEILTKIKEEILKVAPYKPDIAIVLGSGMGGFIEHYKVDMTIDYSTIDNMPKATVDGHNGALVFFKANGRNVLCLQGRVHMYEGYKAVEAVRLTRILGLLGAKTIILTNAAGGVDTSFKPGDLMMINDQVNLFISSPLMGPNIDELGTRFPDMSNLYDEDLQEVIRKAAKKVNVDLKEGVYTQVYGPHFETKSDIKILKSFGVGSVAMSTGIEAIAAHHMGCKVLGFSYISNMATGLGKPVTHEELLKNSKATVDKLIKIFDEAVDKI